MNLLSIRTDFNSLEGHRAVADKFVDAVVARDFVTAAMRIEKAVHWFGELVQKADWIARCNTAFANAKLAAQIVGDIDPQELRTIPALTIAESIDGPLEKTHRLHVYQLCRNEIWVTIGVLTVGTEKVVVDRIIDLRRLKQLAAA